MMIRVETSSTSQCVLTVSKSGSRMDGNAAQIDVKVVEMNDGVQIEIYRNGRRLAALDKFVAWGSAPPGLN